MLMTAATRPGEEEGSMPTYTVTALDGCFDAQKKAKIAAEKQQEWCKSSNPRQAALAR